MPAPGAIFKDKQVTSESDIKVIEPMELIDIPQMISVLEVGPVGFGFFDWFMLYGLSSAVFYLFVWIVFVIFEIIKGILQDLTRYVDPGNDHFLAGIDGGLEFVNVVCRCIVSLVASILFVYFYHCLSIAMLRLAKGHKMTLVDIFMRPATNMGMFLVVFLIVLGLMIAAGISVFGIPLALVVPFFIDPHWFFLAAEQESNDILNHLQLSVLASVRNWQASLLNYGMRAIVIVTCMLCMATVWVFEFAIMEILSLAMHHNAKHSIGGVFVYIVFILIYDAVIVFFVALTGPFLHAFSVILHGKIFLEAAQLGELDVPTEDFDTAVDTPAPAQDGLDGYNVVGEEPTAPAPEPEVQPHSGSESEDLI